MQLTSRAKCLLKNCLCLKLTAAPFKAPPARVAPPNSHCIPILGCNWKRPAPSCSRPAVKAPLPGRCHTLSARAMLYQRAAHAAAVRTGLRDTSLSPTCQTPSCSSTLLVIGINLTKHPSTQERGRALSRLGLFQRGACRTCTQL